ncbi:MAG: prepilin-type N-terminal cleavage/methylation domain-containing protein [Pseudomonadales bacterium]|nr:prepilin-type N-terminal cleavage/methylation domain-containing protein [Pseudomonadales bacterium]
MRQLKGSKQQGFTLVEIAVVLVIIGLLLGVVLQGTELIDNSRIKKASSDISAVSAAYLSYQDRYKKLPGDDGPNLVALTGRGGDWATVTQFGNNNGSLTAALNSTWNGGGEHDNFWQHLRAAGYISGNPADEAANALPKNPWGGLMGITVDAMGGGLNGLKLCMSQVPGKSAAALDLQLDDGLGATGQMRATLGTAGANTNPTNVALAAPYNESNEYTICSAL